MSIFSWLRAKNAVAPTPALLDRIEKLERERENYLLELQTLADRCHEILDQAEHRRGRAAAAESRNKKRESHAEPTTLEELWNSDPSAARDVVKQRFSRKLQ